MFERSYYLDRMISYDQKPSASGKIMVLSGVRGAGKSSILAQYRDRRLREGVSEDQILWLDLEYDARFDSFFDQVKGWMAGKPHVWIFLDEVSSFRDWEKAAAAFTFYPATLILTGSHRLSEEFYSLFDGQFLDLPVNPLSFRELSSPGDGDGGEDLLSACLSCGGFPRVWEDRCFAASRSGSPAACCGFPRVGEDRDGPGAHTESAGMTYTRKVHRTLEQAASFSLVRDVQMRQEAADFHTIYRVLAFLTREMGRLNSPNSVAKALSEELTGKAKTVAMRTAEKYLNLLQDAYFLFSVPRYDIRRRETLKTMKKYYFCDPGLITCLAGDHRPGSAFSGQDPSLSMMEGRLENLVYLKLRRLGFQVFTGKIGERTVDFIAQAGREKTYIQVAPSLRQPADRIRELLPLRMIQDNYEKIILTPDPDFSENNEGIHIRSLRDWLLE